MTDRSIKIFSYEHAWFKHPAQIWWGFDNDSIYLTCDFPYSVGEIPKNWICV